MRSMILILTVAACYSTIAEGLGAQEPLNWVRPDAGTCDYAVRGVSGEASLPDREKALWSLRSCGEDGATALAEELSRLRDISEFKRLLASYYPIASLLDARIVDAALMLASDAAATPASRIVAFKLIVSYKHKHFVSLPPSTFVPGNPPELSAQNDFERFQGDPLPSDWEKSAQDLLSRLSEDGGESETIRYAARWALQLLSSGTVDTGF